MNDPTESDNISNPYTQTSIERESVVLRPTGVTVIGVLCILGGIMGSLSGLAQAGQQFAQGISTAFVPAGEAGDAQREWFAEVHAISDKYLIPSIGFAFAALALGICMVIGGVALLKPKKWARTWVRRTLLAAIVIESLHQVLYIVWQIELYPVMARQFDVMVAPGGNGNPAGSPEMLKTMQTIILFVSYGFGAFWFLTKLVAYVWGRRYLKRDTVKAYCGESTEA